MHNDQKLSDLNTDNFYVGSVNGLKSAVNEWTQIIQVGENNFLFKLDTGAEVNTCSIDMLSSSDNINACNITLEAFGGTKIKPLGTTRLKCKVNNIVKNIRICCC